MATPDGAPRDHFTAGEPIYAKVSFDASHASLGGQVEVRVDDFPCLRAPLPSSSFTIDVVRAPNPSTVRAPQVPYDAQCLELYEQAVRAGRSFAVAIKVKSATGEIVVDDHAKVARATAPTDALALLHRTFEATSILPTSAPFARDPAALVAVQTFTEETRKTEAVPLAVALQGAVGYVAMRRPNGTCFVQPQVTFAWRTKLDTPKDAFDVVHENFRRTIKLHEVGAVDDEALAKAQRVYEAHGGHAERIFEIVRWPGAYDESVWPREPKPYDLPCSHVE